MRKPPPTTGVPLCKWLSATELDEALNTPLPSRPPPARLPPMTPFRRRSKLGSPPYFDNLTRSTMPTASLDSHLNRPPPILLARGQGSSMDTLRSLQTRSMSTSESDKPASTSTSSWWFQSPLTTMKEALSEPPSPPPEPTKQFLSPKNPVVFCHGLLGFDSVTIGPAIAPLQVTHWRGIKEVLEENGTEVLITRVPATSSPMDRAKVLEETISKKYPGRSVHLIGHSMGGLDCRYLTTHLPHRLFNILSVTTIATPHRGSPFASTFLSTVGSSRMPSVLSLLALLPNGSGDGKAFESLTPESMKAFNEDTPDVDGVRYFSWGATYEPGLIDTWKWPHSVILEHEGENDGLVSVESAKWGTYLGTLHAVNHLDLVGWVNTARYKWAEMMGKEIKFRPASFYLGVADMLAREVEGQGDEASKGEGEREGGEDGTKLKRTKSQEEREQMVDSLGKAGAEVKETDQRDDDDMEERGRRRDRGEHKVEHPAKASSSPRPSNPKRPHHEVPNGKPYSTSTSSQHAADSSTFASHPTPQSTLELLPPTPPEPQKQAPKLELLPPTPDATSKPEPKLILLPPTPP